MLLIITATDFSEVAENAANYACELASARNARVIFLHSFIIPVMFSDIPMPGSLITDAQNDAEIQMAKLVSDMTISHPGLDIKGKVIYGDTVDVLDQYTEDNNYPWLIVVGNSGSEENNSWPDSTLMSVFKKMEYPVLAIPPHLTYHPVQRICFAFDNKHQGNDAALQQIKDLTQRLNSELHVLNIQPKNTPHDSNPGIDADAKKQLADVNPIYHFVYDSEDVTQAIRDFTEKNNIDWLVMMPRKHSFFEGLFYKSHTKAIAHNSHIPILALHEKNS